MELEERLLEGLNPPQREAVSHRDGPMLVIAGAGSGKTRVVTRRVAHLLATGVSPYDVLALTFTNKAAGEMAKRVEQLVGHSRVWMGTFHSFCARQLRKHATTLGYTANYTIYDTDDRLRLIKDVLGNMELDTANWQPGKVEDAISLAKTEMLSPAQYAERNTDYYGRTVAKIYERYEQKMLASNAMDFDDLLMKFVQLVRERDEVREELAGRFRYVLVDEYQDTNRAQYEIVWALAAKSRNLHVTGDPDQSIYGWRGADINNILDFEKDFPDAKVVKLEQNYRSTQLILDAAHGVIEHNELRKEKRLWTERTGGMKVAVELLQDEASEADWVAETVAKMLKEGTRPNEVAVFYRVNALSRELERALMRAEIPYAVVAGTAFYERKEIRDALAYLKVLVNPSDDVSMKRIFNVPARDLGKTSQEKVEQFANENQLSMCEACQRAREVQGLNKRAKDAVAAFAEMLDELREHVDERADEFLKRVLERIGYMAHLDKGDKPDERKENVEELVSAVGILMEEQPEATAVDFLQSVALVSDADALDAERGTVSLMTLHSAKGLEFRVVFIVGMEEGLMPHHMSRDAANELEEERRLCYVGFTRAMERLFVSHTRTRMQFGLRSGSVASRFLAEIPPECIERPIAALGLSRESSAPEAQEPEVDELQVGDRIEHPTYGRGRVVDVTGSGGKARVRVTFAGGAVKTFVLDHAPLTKLS